jgi:hypothetical protein
MADRYALVGLSLSAFFDRGLLDTTVFSCSIGRSQL